MGTLRQLRAGVVAFALFTAVLGVGYPAAVWVFSRLNVVAAEGSAVRDPAGCVVGSSLVGVDPRPAPGVPDGYLHGRVVGDVATGDAFAPGDPAAAAPLNRGLSSDVFADFLRQRRAMIAVREGVDPVVVPADAVTGPGSGVDPDISAAYAALQVPRIARVHGLSEDRVRAIVAENTSPRRFGVLGEDRVNVLGVNIALGYRCGG